MRPAKGLGRVFLPRLQGDDFGRRPADAGCGKDLILDG
jgi:hypothetical protein